VTSKRGLKRDVEQLSEERDSGGGVGLYLFTTANNFESRSDAPRPELTVPDDVRDGYTTAVPNVVPDKFERPILFLTDAVVGTWDGDAGDSSIPVSELWDNLTDEQLREERRRREKNDDPIPALLKDYDPKE
jgi:hypothetical protein